MNFNSFNVFARIETYNLEELSEFSSTHATDIVSDKSAVDSSYI